MKKISLLIFILLNFMLSASAQQNSPNPIQNTEIEELVDYDKVKIKPQFKGETWAFYLSHNLRYPENALKNKISGKVYVSFIIEKSGDISNVTLVEGLGYGLDEEAIRLIKNSPKWKPGYQDKKVLVRVSCIIPISFNPI
jgi:protein TonB